MHVVLEEPTKKRNIRNNRMTPCFHMSLLQCYSLSLGNADALTAHIGSDFLSCPCHLSAPARGGTALAKSAPGRGGRCRRRGQARAARRRRRGLSHGIRSIGAMRLHVRAIALQKEGLGPLGSLQQLIKHVTPIS